MAVSEGKETKHSPVSTLHKSIAGRYRPVRVADGPITACSILIQNVSRVCSSLIMVPT